MGTIVGPVTFRAVHQVVLVVIAATLAAGCGHEVTTQRHSLAAVVPPAKARRIAAQWGGAVTYLPKWAPDGVVLSNWWAETCACGTDDSRLVVQFVRERTRLDWQVSDPQEVHHVAAGIVCRDERFADRVINGRSVFYRSQRDSETAWICIPVSGRLGEGFPLDKLTISVRQEAGRTGQLEPSELERMVVSAHPSPPGRASGSEYELPSQSDVERMATSFRRPLLLPTELPGGFIYSQWYVGDPFDTGERRRQLSISFGRDGLFSHVSWHLLSGVDTLALDCPAQNDLEPLAVIKGRPIYANEGIHGVSVWTCIPADVVGNEEPLEVHLWYDIRLHSSSMLRLATRMVGAARLVSSKPTPMPILKPPEISETFTLLPCPPKPGTTLDLEGCAEHKIVSSDMAIDRRVSVIFSLLRSHVARIRFVRAERTWLANRRTSCESRSDVFEGGSAAGVVFAECEAEQNLAHLEDLRLFERDLEPH